MDKDTVETIGYVLLGVVAAYLLNFGLGLALGTELPVVAVVSNSMTHDSTTLERHYEYLQKDQLRTTPVTFGRYCQRLVYFESNSNIADVR